MSELSAAASILFAVRDHGPLSRAEISRRTLLSQSVVSTVARELLERGVIHEIGTRREELGRPSILLELRNEHSCFVGFSLTGRDARGVATDLGGNLLSSWQATVDDLDPAAVVGLLRQGMPELLADAGVERGDLRGAGLALSGLIDSVRGSCIQSTVMGWEDVPIVRMLEAELGIPVALENDADTVALGERLYGAAQHHDNFAVLSVGQGIGAGVFVDGRLHRGAHGVSGELGHCTVELGGPLCRCGKRGCLEAVAAVPVLLAEARRLGLDVHDLDGLEELAASGDETAASVLHRAGAALGLALSHLVNLFSPAAVIVTGSGTTLGAQLKAALEECYSLNLLPTLPDKPELHFRHEDGAVWARGAAGVAALTFLRAGGEVVPVT